MKTQRKQWALALSVGLVLSACSTAPDELPTPIVQTPSGSEEATDETVSDNGASQSQRADQVLEVISLALETAYTERSTANVLDRVGGPAKLMLDSMFANAARFGDEGLESISTTDADSTWSTSTDFPRVAMVFTANAETGANDQLLVLSQSNGRQNYKLWGAADLVPADVDITFATDTDAIAKTFAETIATSPEQAVTEFAMRLQGGETDVTFEEDPLTTSLYAQRDSITESLGGTGDVALAGRALNHGPLSMATEDGGAVTMGAFEYDVTINRTTAGSTITVGDELAQWMTGEADSTYDVQGTLTSTYVVTVAFYIPPKGGGNVQIIAASTPELTNVTDNADNSPD